MAFISVVSAEQSINLELQSLKQQSLLLDRDLLLLEDKIKQPFSIYVSQKADAKFALETLTLKLDGKSLLVHRYTTNEHKALKKGGAQLIYKGTLTEGEHKLIAYYRSNKNYQGGGEFEFSKTASSQSIEIFIQKNKSKESRLQPKLFIKKTSATENIAPVLYRHLKYLKNSQPNKDILSQVMKAQKLKALGAYAIDTQLFKGQLYLEKGLHVEAGEIFKNIINNNKTAAKLRNEARFYLGKSYYHLGKNKEALAFLSTIREPISKNVRAEMQHLHSLILMSQGEYKKAAQYLRKNWWMAPENWDIYARLNLGVALIHSGDAESGIDLIKKIGKKHFKDAEAKSLVDKANQSLGYLFLNQNEAEKARTYLEKVSLNGAYSNLALLGAGWASARLKQYNQAIVPWMELQKKDMRDIPVQESMLTVPYAFEKMGLLKKSVRFYQKSVKAYEKEQAELISSISALNSNQLKNELFKLKVTSDEAWLESIDNASATKSLRYIKQLIEDGVLFNFLLNFREAKFLKNNASEKINIISDIQTQLLKRAGSDNSETSNTNRDQIKFIQILTADLLKRSNQMQREANSNMQLIAQQMKTRSLSLLALRKDKLDVYLVQSRLALAQSYDRLNP